SRSDPAVRTLRLPEAYGAAARVAFVGLDFLSVSDHHRFATALGQRMVDVTPGVDRLMVKRSDEELALVRGTAAIFDRAWGAVLERARPGMTEWSLASVAGAELL